MLESHSGPVWRILREHGAYSPYFARGVNCFVRFAPVFPGRMPAPVPFPARSGRFFYYAAPIRFFLRAASLQNSSSFFTSTLTFKFLNIVELLLDSRRVPYEFQKAQKQKPTCRPPLPANPKARNKYTYYFKPGRTATLHTAVLFEETAANEKEHAQLSNPCAAIPTGQPARRRPGRKLRMDGHVRRLRRRRPCRGL